MEEIKLILKNECDESIKLIKENLEECCFLKKRVEFVLICHFLPSATFIHQIFALFFDYQIAILKSIEVKKDSKAKIIRTSLHNGEKQFVEGTTIIVGDIHLGSELTIKGLVIIEGKVEGTILMNNGLSAVFIKKCNNAKIVLKKDLVKTINGENIYLDNEKGGEKVWQELSL